MDVNLDLNLAPPGGHPDQERPISSVESNETSQQAPDPSVGTDGNAASSSGLSGFFHQFMPQPAAPIGIHQAYTTGQPPQPAYQTGQTGQPPQLAYQTGQQPKPASIGHHAYQTAQQPQPASTGYQAYQTGQPPQPAYQTGQPPQPATIGTHWAHQTALPPGPAPTGTDRVQPSVVTQKENPINSRRNESRIAEEAESERGTMEPNKPDGRRGASRECSYHYSGFNNNYGGFHGSTININNYAGEGRTREQNNPNRR